MPAPDLPTSLLVPEDFAGWEALYDDGTALREAEGARYGQVDRSRLRSFRIHQGGETLIEAFVPTGATGHDLCYRRSTLVGSRGRSVVFLIGWARTGPVAAVSLTEGRVWTADRFHASCSRCGIDHPLGMFYPPIPHAHEGEHFTQDDLTRAA